MKSALLLKYDVNEAYDCYTGTREALITVGAAKPEWFADVGSPWHKTGRVRRAFYDLEGGRVTLRDHADGTFGVTIFVDEDERAARREEQRLFVYGRGKFLGGGIPSALAFEAARTDHGYQQFLKHTLRLSTCDGPWILDNSKRG